MLVFCVCSFSYAQKSTEGRKLIRSVIRKNADYDRLYFRNCLFSLKYNELEMPEVKGNIKIVRDSAIQITVVPAFGIEAGRILLTKDSIFVINRLNKWFIAESWEDAKLEDFNRLKMKELQDVFLGSLPSRARWLMKKDSMYRINETERAYRMNTGSSGWNILTILDNRKKQLSAIIARRSVNENFFISYIPEKEMDGRLSKLLVKGEIELNGYHVKGSIRMGGASEDKGFRLGAKVGNGYTRKSLNGYIKR
jgi:hypothetical protein